MAVAASGKSGILAALHPQEHKCSRSETAEANGRFQAWLRSGHFLNQHNGIVLSVKGISGSIVNLAVTGAILMLILRRDLPTLG